eukprot:67679_1
MCAVATESTSNTKLYIMSAFITIITILLTMLITCTSKRFQRNTNRKTKSQMSSTPKHKPKLQHHQHHTFVPIMNNNTPTPSSIPDEINYFPNTSSATSSFKSLSPSLGQSFGSSTEFNKLKDDTFNISQYVNFT